MKLVVNFGLEEGSLRKARVKQMMEKVLQRGGIDGEVRVGVSLVGEKTIWQLNRQYLGKDRPTDVLSFPLEKEVGPDGVLRLGDVVVCFQVAERQAKEKRTTVDKEVEFLIKHGLLHLMGVHHE